MSLTGVPGSFHALPGLIPIVISCCLNRYYPSFTDEEIEAYKVPSKPPKGIPLAGIELTPKPAQL